MSSKLDELIQDYSNRLIVGEGLVLKQAIKDLFIELIGKPIDYDIPPSVGYGQFEEGYNEACDDLIKELKKKVEKL